MLLYITQIRKCVHIMDKREGNQKCKRNVKKYTVNIKLEKSLLKM